MRTEDLERYFEIGNISEEGIIFNWQLAGPEGADFFIFPAKWHTLEEIKRTKDWLRNSRDVVTLSVIEVDCKYPIGREWELLSPEKREAEFRRVLDEGYQMIEGSFIDRVTANAVVTVMDALNEKNKKKFVEFPVWKMVDIAWELIEKCSV